MRGAHTYEGDLFHGFPSFTARGSRQPSDDRAFQPVRYRGCAVFSGHFIEEEVRARNTHIARARARAVSQFAVRNIVVYRETKTTSVDNVTVNIAQLSRARLIPNRCYLS